MIDASFRTESRAGRITATGARSRFAAILALAVRDLVEPPPAVRAGPSPAQPDAPLPANPAIGVRSQ